MGRLTQIICYVTEKDTSKKDLYRKLSHINIGDIEKQYRRIYKKNTKQSVQSEIILL